MCWSNLQLQYHGNLSSRSLKCLHPHFYDFQKVHFDLKVLLLTKITTYAGVLLSLQKLRKIVIWTETAFSSQASGLPVPYKQTIISCKCSSSSRLETKVSLGSAVVDFSCQDIKRTERFAALSFLGFFFFPFEASLKSKLLQCLLPGRKKKN